MSARNLRRALTTTTVGVLLALVPAAAWAQAGPAPVVGAGQAGAIAGEYIVVLKGG